MGIKKNDFPPTSNATTHPQDPHTHRHSGTDLDRVAQAICQLNSILAKKEEHNVGAVGWLAKEMKKATMYFSFSHNQSCFSGKELEGGEVGKRSWRKDFGWRV